MRSRTGKLVDPMQFAFSIAAEDLVNYEPVTPWEKGPASEKQLTYLEKMGIDRAYVPNMGMASLYIDRLISRRNEGLSTPKQIRYLEKRGFKHVGTWSFTDASNMMSLLAKNNWSVPYGIIPEMYVPAGA